MISELEKTGTIRFLVVQKIMRGMQWVSWTIFPYLTLGLLHAGQITPLFDGLCQVNLIQCNFYFANLVMFRESAKTKGLI